MNEIRDKLAEIEKRYEELNSLMAQPEVIADSARWQSLAREQASLEGIIARFREYQGVTKELAEINNLSDNSLDSEMLQLVKEERNSLEERRDKLISQLRKAFLSPDTDDKRDVIVEIRAGTGGGEAALFAADLFRMYARYAQAKGWEVEIIDSNLTGLGGFKEVVFEVRGKNAFSRLKYERGVHRVQRVPVTEAGGRVHTSTATVAVLPQVDDVEVELNPNELKIEFFHSSGPGGQNVNKVTTAVRIIHLPTGITAACQDDRSQFRNRSKAMSVLRARLFDLEQRRRQEEISKERHSQIGAAERAEKIRTYNFPQNRLTDHRINLSLYNLSAILEGGLDGLIDALAEGISQKEAVSFS
jgi:peptide chain release factor 1